MGGPRVPCSGGAQTSSFRTVTTERCPAPMEGQASGRPSSGRMRLGGPVVDHDGLP